jgi:predicted phosphoribosyltransferase
MRYRDRADAGRRLAPHVAPALATDESYVDKPLLLGVPRGGVVVAAAIAGVIPADLDVVIARKIGAPANAELAIGAVGEQGEPILDHDLVNRLGVTEEYVTATVATERLEMRRRIATYRGSNRRPSITGRIAVIVDDGIATGATLLATIETVRKERPALLVCAVPVGAPGSVDQIADHVDVMVCPLQPRAFRAVGEWYQTFTQTTDAEVVAVLQRFRETSD